ncbi:MAG: VWA domain-containing protein [Candidatus Eremiobacteraeota bacterium]|nr:VWA domain-containing protein [Candidatus Eremiobacteraeota bacterium]
MHIANPLYLILLIVPLFLLLFLLKWGSKRSARVRFSMVKTARKSASPLAAKLRHIPMVLRVVTLTLLILALTRVQFGQKSEERTSLGTDIIICLDTSPSMKALDFKPKNRITVAKEVVQDFIRGRRDDRLGMVVFAGASVTVCPLTTDYGSLLQFLNEVDEGITKTDGTAIGDALATSVNRLKNSTAKSKIIILVTDGRSNVGMLDPLSAAKLAKSMGIKIYAIGVGKKGPAPFPVEDRIFGTRYVMLQEDLDEETLTKIATITGGTFERATDEASLSRIFKTIDSMEKTVTRTRVNIDYRELYQYLLWPALALLLVEIITSQGILRKIP